MNMREFYDYAKGRLVPVYFELEGKKRTELLVFAPLCFLTFNEQSIIVTQCGSLSLKKKKDPMGEISYGKMDHIDAWINKRIGVAITFPVAQLFLNIVVHLEDGERLHFISDMCSDFPPLLDLFRRKNIPVNDLLNLESVFNNEQSYEKVYNYIMDNLTSMAETAGIDVWKLDLMES